MILPSALRSCAVSTPPDLAEAMVRALGFSPANSWLDPCVGDGTFLRALNKLGVQPGSITAVDLDPTPSPDDVLASTLRGIDFIAWSQKAHEPFDKIVANPPYIALRKLGPSLRKSATSLQLPTGRAIGLVSNYWSAFLIASLALLRRGGDFCFVLPASWEYADYATLLRESLWRSFERFHVHRSRGPMFRPVRDGCIVIVGYGFGRPNYETLRFEYESGEALTKGLLGASTGRTDGIEVARSPQLLALARGMCRLGDVLDIRLGGVTGDTRYFLMTDHQRRQWGFPLECLRPVLSKARHLIAGEMTRRHWKSLRQMGNERIWLFDPPPRLVEHPSVRAYLRLAEYSGGCRRDRYKIKKRSPWYRTPLERHSDGFISGMSRFGPWITLRKMPRLSATNTLYVVRFLKGRTRDEKAAWSLSLLTSRTRELVTSFGRRYADGLLKYEPSDIRAIPVTIPRKVRGARTVYIKAVEALVSGQEMKCRKIADEWFQEPPSESATQEVKGIGAGAQRQRRDPRLQLSTTINARRCGNRIGVVG